MKVVDILTYDIREHCISYFNDAIYDSHALSFWRQLLRRIRRARHMRACACARRQKKHPFYNECTPLKQVVFAPISDNNRRALEPLWSRLNTETYSIMSPSMEEYIPTKLVYFYALTYIWPLLKCYLLASKQDKYIIRTYFDELFETIGYVVVLDKLLKHSDVKLIVLANDHCAYPRALVKIAQLHGTRTMYMQHCSITDLFPALPFDYSFLDGEESYLKYCLPGKPDGSVYLSGSPRFDVIKKYKTTLESRHGIGIATNALDKVSEVRELCLRLLEAGYKGIIIRPHPDLEFDPTWYLERGIGYSDSNKENPFEFLSKMKYVIAGECGIHLDAALLGVISVCHNMTGNNNPPADWYSYIKNGLVPYSASIDELLPILEGFENAHNMDMSGKTQWYNAAYNTDYEGHIGEMLADFIRFEQKGDKEGFDRKYGFVQKEINGNLVKVFNA